MTTILVYTADSATAAFPIVRGLGELAARGHDVEIVTGAAHLADIAQARKPGHALAVSAVAPDIAARAGDLAAHRHAEAADFRAHVERTRPDVVLVDSAAHGALDIASGMGVPVASLVLRPAGLADASRWPGASLVPLDPWWRDAFGPPSDGRSMTNTTPSTKTQATMQPTTQPATRARPSKTARTTTQQTTQLTTRQTMWTGAADWEPSPGDSGWLNTPGDPWVLVATGGASYRPDATGRGAHRAPASPEELLAARVSLARSAVAALRETRLRIAVTLGAAFDAAHLIPSANARVMRFWPHGDVLRHARALIAPATSTAMTKALAAGVPVVVVPFDHAGKQVASHIAATGVGTSVPLRKLRARRLRPAVGAAIDMAARVSDLASGMVDGAGPASGSTGGSGDRVGMAIGSTGELDCAAELSGDDAARRFADAVMALR